MSPPSSEPVYVTGIEEVLWGSVLVAITLAIHGFGMLLTLRVDNRLNERFPPPRSFVFGMSSIILASWLIIMVHLAEVFVWAGFFLWKGALAGGNASLSFYFALLEYTTLGSNYNLKLNWRLLEGMIAIAGLLTFAWSTGVLLTLAEAFQAEQLIKRPRVKSGSKPKATHAHPAPDPKSD